jgi:hypothetical protein
MCVLYERVILPDGRSRNVALITVYEIHLAHTAQCPTLYVHKSIIVTRFLGVYFLSTKNINISFLDLVKAVISSLEDLFYTPLHLFLLITPIA